MGQGRKNRSIEFQYGLVDKLLLGNIKRDLEEKLSRQQQVEFEKLLMTGNVVEVRNEKETGKLFV
jgi:hypothetical protein